MLQQIRTVTDKPVRTVVLSHYHADHIYGLQAFRNHTDATILAQANALDYAAEGSLDNEKAAPRLEQRRQALSPGSMPTRASSSLKRSFRRPRSSNLAAARSASSLPVVRIP